MGMGYSLEQFAESRIPTVLFVVIDGGCKMSVILKVTVPCIHKILQRRESKTRLEDTLKFDSIVHAHNLLPFTAYEFCCLKEYYICKYDA